MVSLCVGCNRAKNVTRKGKVVAGKIPDYSIAAGYDFGYTGRVNLPKLSHIEGILIARNLTHLNLFKLKLKNRSTSDTDQQCMTGHKIAFPHNGIYQLNGPMSLPRRTVSDAISISFFGTTSQFNQVKICIRSTKQFQVSRRKLVIWLTFLKSVGNQYYQDVKVSDYGMDDDTYETQIVDELMESIRVVDDPFLLYEEDKRTANLNGM